MSHGPDDSDLGSIPDVGALRVRFESEWTARANPRIEAYLNRVPAPWQAALLRALLPLEIELRTRAGDAVTRDELQDRFPDFSTIVDELVLPFGSTSSTSFVLRSTVESPGPMRTGESARIGNSEWQEGAVLSRNSDPVAALQFPGPPVHPQFQIVRCIGRGGMGVVYEALDRESGARMAIKTLHQRFSESTDRLKREFRTLCDVRHPNLVALHQLYVQGDSCFFTMEYVEGQPFHWACWSACDASAQDHDTANGTEATGRPVFEAWTPEALRRLRDEARQVVEGVCALHDAGFVHRDLKPTNVLVTVSGRVVVLDLGLALKLHAGDVVATVPTGGAGTVAYMAPEQAAGASLTPAADWYSFGVMLYQTLTARLPFNGTRAEMADAKLRSPPAPPVGVRGGIPPDLSDLCLALLAPDPERRPRADEIARVLSQRWSPPVRTVPRAAPGRRVPLFVGREQELARLRLAVDTASPDHPRIVIVRGEPGQGKTRLVDEFVCRRSHPHDHLVLSGRCFERENTPYKAWDTVVAVLVEAIRELNLPVSDWLEGPEQTALAGLFPCFQGVLTRPVAEKRNRNEPIDRRTAAFAALRRLVASLAEARKLLITIDDVQWADHDSAALLREVFLSPGSAPVVLIFTARTNAPPTAPFVSLIESLTRDARAAHISEIELAPLNGKDCEKLVREFLESLDAPGATPETVRILSATAAGHPLLAYALTQVYASGRVSATSGTGERTVQLALEEWISDLPAATRQLLSVICLATHPLSQRVALAAADVREDPEAAISLLDLSGLIDLSYTQRETQLMPFHDVVREQVSAALDGVARTAVHRRLAAALEAEPGSPPEVLAHHFSEAGETEKAANYYVAAGARASESLAFELAAQMYRQALAQGRQPRDLERQVRERQAEALAAAGYSSEAGDAYLLAAGLTPEPVDHRRLLRSAAYECCVSGRIDDGARVQNQFLRHFGMRLSRSRLEVLTRLLVERARLALRGGLRFTTRPPADIAPELLERVDVTWETSVALTMIDTLQGAVFQTRNLRLALAAGDPARIARGCCWQAAHLSTRGQQTRSTVSRLLTCADDLRKKVSTDYLDALAELAGGIAAYFLGEWENATRRCESAAATFRERCRHVSWEVNTAQAFWLWSLLFRGELKVMSDELPRLLDEARRRGNRLSESSLANFGGPHVWMARDEPDRAAESVNRAMEMWPADVFHVQHFTSLAGLAQIDLYAGRVEEAFRRIESHWGRLRRSLFLEIEAIRIFMLHLRGRCGLALAARTRDRRTLLGGVARDARRLERETAPWATAMARNLRAGIARLEDRVDQADACLAEAIAGFARAEMRLFEMCARRARGRLGTGADHERDVEIAEQWMRSQEIANLDAMTNLHSPGLSFS
jgi:serine/threonine protein kinase/tetratricopeptide (TPR) repeat protein